MCQALIIKKVQAFIFLKTRLLVACYQVVFYDDHNVDTIVLIYLDFMRLHMW